MPPQANIMMHSSLKGVVCTQRRSIKQKWTPPPRVAAKIIYSNTNESSCTRNRDRALALRCFLPFCIGLLIWICCIYTIDQVDIAIVVVSLLCLVAIVYGIVPTPDRNQALDMREIVVVDHHDQVLLDSDEEIEYSTSPTTYKSFDNYARTFSTQSTIIDSDCEEEDYTRYSLASTVAIEDDEDDFSDFEVIEPPPKVLKRKLSSTCLHQEVYKCQILSRPKPRPFGQRKCTTPALQRMLDELEAMQEESEQLMRRCTV
ncbi:hypothetical protein THRCLA_04740 [Thraustotheca clavata]|uniref:Transmembrane protein n=1 Tax=Thraustotheca clavata TaxID=74557 RepID=A0A1V9ZY38_9STRA|nr:hypothetical protein THRCLA_04740 [Thraustotheca clavata]